MRTWIIPTLALALPLALGCGDGGDAVTAPDGPGLDGFETIAASEIAAAGDLAGLSDADRAAIRAALEAARAEIEAILARLRAGEIDREEARDRIGAVHDRLLDDLSAFLSDGQIARFVDHRLWDRPGPPPGHRPDLDLTDEQIREIRALLHAFHAFVRDVRARVEGGDLTAREGRRLVRAEAQATREAVCAVLEPRQQAKVPFCRGPVGDAGDANGSPTR